MELNWEAIGAAGEIIGAVAVVVTLVYLTFQLRQNTKAVEHATHRGVYEDGREWMYRLVENPEVAELYRIGMRGEELSANDHLRFRLLLQALFNHWEHAYESGAFEIVDNAEIPGVLSQPGGAAFWQSTKEARSPGFVEYIDGVRGKVAEQAREDSGDV
jgi:hypothetical protein